MRFAAIATMLALLTNALGTTARADQPAAFDGVQVNMGNLFRTSKAVTRSISPESFTGEKGKAAMATEGTGKGAARDLGRGWKISPSVAIKARSTFTLGEIAGPGAIQHIWMTPAPLDKTRLNILRFYWDDEKQPSIEVPLGDFFACGWGKYCQINSLPVCVNPGSAFNCYWVMPFHKKAKVTLENLDDRDMRALLPDRLRAGRSAGRRGLVPRPVPARKPAALQVGLHPVGRRSRPRAVRGHVHGVGSAQPGLVGRGRDQVLPRRRPRVSDHRRHGVRRTIFCGSYNFENRETRLYQTFSTPYTGLAQVLPPNVAYVPGQRFGLYRWHIADPVRFEKDLKVTIQALGWQTGGRYLPLQDDIASVAYWYQTEPHAPFPALPAKNALLVKPQKLAPAPAKK